MRAAVRKLNMDNLWTWNFRVFKFRIFGGIRKYFYTENFRIYGTQKLLCTVSTCTVHFIAIKLGEALPPKQSIGGQLLPLPPLFLLPCSDMECFSFPSFSRIPCHPWLSKRMKECVEKACSALVSVEEELNELDRGSMPVHPLCFSWIPSILLLQPSKQHWVVLASHLTLTTRRSTSMPSSSPGREPRSLSKLSAHSSFSFSKRLF